jgi:hypothetical protein
MLLSELHILRRQPFILSFHGRASLQVTAAVSKTHPLAEKLSKAKPRKSRAVSSKPSVTDVASGQPQGEPAKKVPRRAEKREGASPKSTKKQVTVATSVKITDTIKEKADRIRLQLLELYPDPPIPLDFATNFQLLVAVMLSAQVLRTKYFMLLCREEHASSCSLGDTCCSHRKQTPTSIASTCNKHCAPGRSRSQSL